MARAVAIHRTIIDGENIDLDVFDEKIDGEENEGWEEHRDKWFISADVSFRAVH